MAQPPAGPVLVITAVTFIALFGACGGAASTPTPTASHATASASSSVIPVPSPTATVPILPPLPADPADASTDLYFVYKWAEDIKPRYNQVIAGILIGPDVIPHICPPSVKGDVMDHDAAVGPLLDLVPSYLPADIREDEWGRRVYGCAGEPAQLERSFYVPGTAVRHPGFVWLRRRTTGDPAASVDRPAERMKEGEIAGLPAVIVEPMLPEPYQHWANVTVIVWDAASGVLTVVETDGLTLDETILIAEGLFTSD